tara:strand:+ start:347 stop:1198 length:852 start_codon:yes stop_codon:yes gene_type:complete
MPAMPPQHKTESHRDYCADQVRRYDYHRYFSATLASEDVRRGLLALYAFNLEIAATRERVSEALLGQMRLQWWRETLDGIYGGTVRNHAVVSELARAVEAADLPRDGFDRMIDGRLFDLEDEPPEDANALTNYVSATSGELTRLAMIICGRRDLAGIADAAGRLWGVTGLLRALPHHARQRRIYIPRTILRAENVSPEDVIERTRGKDMTPAFRTLAGMATTSGTDDLRFPRTVGPAVSYIGIARPYLRRLERAGYDVFDNRLEPSRFAAQMRILRSAVSGKV